MSPEELLADTNRMLRELLDIEHERKQDAEKSKATLKSMQEAREQKRQETMTKLLVDRGIPEQIAAIPEGEFEQRAADVRARSQENIKTMETKNAEYRDAVLAELRLQSELLEKIAQKMDKGLES